MKTITFLFVLAFGFISGAASQQANIYVTAVSKEKGTNYVYEEKNPWRAKDMVILFNMEESRVIISGRKWQEFELLDLRDAPLADVDSDGDIFTQRIWRARNGTGKHIRIRVMYYVELNDIMVTVMYEDSATYYLGSTNQPKPASHDDFIVTNQTIEI